MKNKLIFTAILFFTSISCIKSQNTGIAFDLGYKYQTRSLGYTGVSFASTSGRPYDSGSTSAFSLGGGVSMGLSSLYHQDI